MPTQYPEQKCPSTVLICRAILVVYIQSQIGNKTLHQLGLSLEIIATCSHAILLEELCTSVHVQCTDTAAKLPRPRDEKQDCLANRAPRLQPYLEKVRAGRSRHIWAFPLS